MPWVEAKDRPAGWLVWVEPKETLSDILTKALATLKEKPFSVGDEITIRARVTGINKNAISVVLDNTPAEFVRSFTYPAAVLAGAAKKVAA